MCGRNEFERIEPVIARPEAGRRASRLPLLFALPALALALGACGDNRTSEANRQDQIRSAKLVLPSTITPPVHVGAISGAPGGWKLASKVAWALRQRDIPATDGTRRDGNYRLTAALTRSGPGGGQLVIRWRLSDAAGRKVGEVTQVAALPPGDSPNEDILESIADAAAESLSPIIPSSKLQTARRFDTGEPTSRPPREVDDRNRVTAVGKVKTDTPLARNLLKRPKATGTPPPGGDGTSAGAGGATKTSDRSVTALGRMGTGSSALSRNLIRSEKPAPGKTRSTTDNDRINTQSTTSRQPRVRASDREATASPTGSMTDLIRRYPTSVERRTRDGVEDRADAKGGAKVIRVADNRRPTIARDFRPVMRDQVADAGNKANAGSGNSRFLWWVQIGSYRSAAEGESQWSRLRGRAGGRLDGIPHRVVRKDLGQKGVWYRLQVGPAGSKADALKLCGQLKAAGLGCFLVAERNPGGSTPSDPPRATSRPPATNGGGTTSNDKSTTTRKAETPPPARPKEPTKNDGNGMSVYDWKKSDKKADPKEPPLSTRPGLPGLTN